MKIFIISILASFYLFAHPVSYTVDLEAKYDPIKKELKVLCNSNIRNKCGLHNFHLLSRDDKILQTEKFPFLKNEVTINNIDSKPYRMIFFLRKIPDHTYNVIVQ